MLTLSSSSAVGPIKPNLLESYIHTLFSCCYTMIPGKSLGWEGDYVSYYDWQKIIERDFLSQFLFLPASACRFSHIHVQAHTPPRTSLSLCWKALSSSELIDSVSPMTEQARPPSSSVWDKTPPTPAPGFPAENSKGLPPHHSPVMCCFALNCSDVKLFLFFFLTFYFVWGV